jgi:hypothetical protein
MHVVRIGVILCRYVYAGGAWGSVVVKALRYYSDGLWIDSRWCQSLGIFPVATDGTMCPGVDSASENEYQGFLLVASAKG